MGIEDDLIINKFIFDDCNHPDHTTETKVDGRYEVTTLICTVCGFRKVDFEYSEQRRNNPADYMSKFIPFHSRNITMAREVVQHLEKHGWKYMLRGRDGLFRAEFKKEKEFYMSKPKPTEFEAITNAAILLANSLSTPIKNNLT